MSNDKAIARAFKLWAKIAMMVVDGKRDATSVANVLQSILDDRSSKDTTHLRFLESTTLAPTKGDVTIAEASNALTGYISPFFKNQGTNVAGKDTFEAGVSVYEQVKKGDFRTLFGSIGDPRSLCLTQGQIVEFCRKYRSMLRRDCYSTFFLFEVNSELFVAFVEVYVGSLRVGLSHFDKAEIWTAESRHRLVVPQQTL